MDLVNESLDFWYYTLREIPKDLDEAGHKLVSAYHLRERFFHFEFFRTPAGGIVALEVNMRPPGGLTTDMWNYANDIDIYKEYANVVVSNRFAAVVERPYYCGYVGRRNNREYLHPHNEVIVSFPHHLVQQRADQRHFCLGHWRLRLLDPLAGLGGAGRDCRLDSAKT